MERLTERCAGVIKINGCSTLYYDAERKDAPAANAIVRLAAYEDTGLEPEEIVEVQEAISPIPFGRFHNIMEAERDGRLVVLPCKVGDTVYEVNKRGFVSTYEVITIHVSSGSVLVGWDLIDGIYSNLNGFEVSALGKTVFLTREEAEAALKKREEDNETD